MEEYPKEVLARDVVNTIFGHNLFMIKDGRALYDEVWMKDGGCALYLVRVRLGQGSFDLRLEAKKRWIPWDTVLIQMFEV